MMMKIDATADQGLTNHSLCNCRYNP